MRSNLHYITEEDGRSLLVQNGIVSASSQPKPLPHPPAGAKDVVVSWERITNRFGIQRTFTTPLQFVLEAARIIRHVFFHSGYEHKLYYLVQRLTTEVTEDTFRQWYRYLYRGEMDLSTLKDEGDFVTCNIIEGGLDRVLRAKESTVYEIPFDDDAVLVRMDGIPMFSRSGLVCVEQTLALNPGVAVYELMWLTLGVVNVDGTIVNGSTHETQILTHLSSSDHDDNRNHDNFFFEAADDITITIKFPAIAGTLINGLHADLYIKNSNGSRVVIHELFPDNPAGSVAFQKIQQFDAKEVVLSLAKGEKLYLITQLTESPLIVGGCAVIWGDFELAVEFESTYRTTYIKAFKPFDLFRKLIEKITGSDKYAYSELLQVESNLLITSGDAIRGINGAALKTSLAAFFDHCNVAHFAGESVEGEKILIEPRARFYDTSNPVHLGSVKELKYSLATDLLGNTLKIGWPEPEIEELNGRYSFNGSHVYESEITRIPKEISIVSPYSADPYEIEIKRLNLEGKITTDDEADNKVYCINAVKQLDRYESSGIGFNDDGGVYSIFGVPDTFPLLPGMKFVTLDPLNAGPYTIKERISTEPAKVTLIVEEPVTSAAAGFVVIIITTGVPHVLKRINYDTLQGVPTSQVFNIEEMTPKRLLRKHGPWLRSLFYPLDNTSLKFTTTQRNKDLLTEVGGVTIEEKSLMPINMLGPRLFIPIYFEFETMVPINIIEILESEPNRCFSFEWMGKTYLGFNVRSSVSLNSEESQSMKLLCAPEMDLTKLVY